MLDFDELVKRYIAAWNEADPAARADAVARLWTEDGRYTDPLAEASGHEGIAAVIAQAHGLFPDHVFRALPGVDSHHRVARFGWELVPDGGSEPVAVGFDVAEAADDGRISAVYGFLDKAPALG
ncbi:nuclear transport factor 2 family protein [Streptomonospora wellingtoniae]|uniref:Nuclear transport factor 2 family protein n=1 Tax=Streptomonospora wellingtoniae TaxID=3075544 RepID=A0ABU2KVE3_9ACTN|nr:nuclear transport factor 2 family protein [Streptomonospora sp. DSM 45055]MDT0303023.1 nuclear transport factor 2 family protein [Streptomonospora sp. DSM 45055]